MCECRQLIFHFLQSNVSNIRNPFETHFVSGSNECCAICTQNVFISVQIVNLLLLPSFNNREKEKRKIRIHIISYTAIVHSRKSIHQLHQIGLIKYLWNVNWAAICKQFFVLLLFVYCSFSSSTIIIYLFYLRKISLYLHLNWLPFNNVEKMKTKIVHP